MAEPSAGVIYDDASENFTLTVYPTTVYRDGSGTYLSYRATVMNKSRETYRGFYPTFVLDQGLDQYLAAGAQPLPMSKVDLFPAGAPEVVNGSGGRGEDLAFDPLLSDPAFLDEAGLPSSRIRDLARTVTLWLRWDGGEESIEYTAPILDPGGVLEP